VVLVLLALMAGPPLWWSIQLVGLPDIGEPFDGAAFRALTIPADRNAFVLYGQAAARLEPLEQSATSKDKPIDLLVRWSKALPEVRRWVEANREALDLYRQGAERPDALDPSLASDSETARKLDWTLRSSQRLALLAASRLEEQGDMAGAWVWYRAILRTIRLVSVHGTVVRRLDAQRWQVELRDRLTSWAAATRTTPALLRSALDDVVACESLAPSESYTLKVEHLNMEWLLDGPDNPGQHMPPSWLMSLASRKSTKPLVALLPPEQVRSITAAWRSWRRETERSRRVLRLVTANWLAYYDLPPGDRPRPDLDPFLVAYDFYAFAPDAPAQARALSPQALDRWLKTTYEAREMLSTFHWSRLRVTERANHRALVILLASQLYRRERGTDPPTPEALVGPYLKGLPAVFPADRGDETIPRPGGTIKRGPIPEFPKK
jgi:hypothetical protein